MKNYLRIENDDNVYYVSITDAKLYVKSINIYKEIKFLGIQFKKLKMEYPIGIFLEQNNEKSQTFYIDCATAAIDLYLKEQEKKELNKILEEKKNAVFNMYCKKNTYNKV